VPGTWTASNPYTLNAVILDGNVPAHVQQVTAAGTSGPGPAPSFSTTGGDVIDGLTWTDLGTSVAARYPVTGQTSLQALALDPLVRDCTTAGSCSSSLPARKVNNFWLADSVGSTMDNFFRLDFATGTSTQFSTTPPCASCGIQSIGIYGAEDAAQPGLTQPPPALLTTPANSNITNTATFHFNPNPQLFPTPNDDNQLNVTGYNFPSNFTGGLALTVYASAIDPASGTSDSLSTPTPNAPIFAPPAPCTVATSTGQCVVWQLDNNDLPTLGSCATNPSTCSFLWVKVDFSNITIRGATDFNNVIGVLDEQYDATASPDIGLPKTKCQISLHTITPTVPGAANCTYVNPLSPSSSSPPACFTKSRTNIPVKFTCTDLDGKTLADLLPFLHVFQVFTPCTPPNCNEASFQPLQGTGGTFNYRLTAGQWNFNLNNLGFGYTPNASRADYQACTKDANGIVEQFCTRFYVKKSCP